MPEEVFRQQRKPIDRSEIQETFAAIEEVNRVAKEEVGETFNSPNSEAVAFTGRMPAELQAKINNLQSPAGESPRVVPPQSQNPRFASPVNSQISSKLHDLLADLKETSNIYERIVLPSLGRFYNGEDGPMDGVLHIRPMTGEEEQILATPRFAKKGVAMDMIFDRCLKESYKSVNLLMIDRVYILIFLRGISYGPDYEVEVTCPFTDKKFSTTIDLNLDMDTCPDDFTSTSLQGVLPKTGYTYQYRLATGQDDRKMQEHRERQTQFDNSTQADDTLLFRTAQLLENIQGIENKLELQTLLKNLPIMDVAHLRNVVNEPPFGINTKITLMSPWTNEEFDIELPLEANFFLPRQKKKMPTPA